MNIAAIIFNPIRENTYILWDETNQCVIIDAGNSSAEEDKALENFIEERGLKPIYAVNTHGHFDHVMGVEFLKSRYGIKFAMNRKDIYLLEAAQEGSVVYGMTLGAMPKEVDVDLGEVDTLTFGETTLSVIQTPGHTPGHVSLLEKKTNSLFTGDTLFRESIGRTDLPGGDYEQLMRSIIGNILPLGDDVKVYPGHSESSTIGHESLYNPFIVEVLNSDVNCK